LGLSTGLSVGIRVLVGYNEVDGIELGLPDGARVGGTDVVGEILGLAEGCPLGVKLGDIDKLGLPEGSWDGT
jgi:hypothetical protein